MSQSTDGILHRTAYEKPYGHSPFVAGPEPAADEKVTERKINIFWVLTALALAISVLCALSLFNLAASNRRFLSQQSRLGSAMRGLQAELHAMRDSEGLGFRESFEGRLRQMDLALERIEGSGRAVQTSVLEIRNTIGKIRDAQVANEESIRQLEEKIDKKENAAVYPQPNDNGRYW
jgi:hypothetical protein